MGEALWRGAQCTADFSQADHLALAEWQLDDVRAHFGVPAPRCDRASAQPPGDGSTGTVFCGQLLTRGWLHGAAGELGIFGDVGLVGEAGAQRASPRRR